VNRYRSLDGLRGVAALIVVFHHSLLAFPAVANYTGVPATGSVLWWFEVSPLKLFSAGAEAVLVFFVLSGFVLVLPVLRTLSYDWVAYYFRRSIRLYLPVVASIALAAVVVYVHPQVAGNGSSWVGTWTMAHPSWGVFAQALDIFEPANGVNNPLWTLRWEMIFSLALPLFAFGAVLLRRWWLVAIAGVFVLVFVGVLKDVSLFQYLPVFLAGSLLAVNAERLSVWADSIRGRRGVNFAWFALLLGGFALLIAHWMFAILGTVPYVAQFLVAISFLGAIVIVAVAFLWQPFARLLTIAPVRWLGRVSFSLYLVHVPIIIACANLFGPGHALIAIAVAIPLSLVVAELFARFVEGPAHRLSKRVGSGVSARIAAMRPDARE
jgi:peptidoglycan/LPS O-acetylase OafA/YrhL